MQHMLWNITTGKREQQSMHKNMEILCATRRRQNKTKQLKNHYL